MTTQISAKSNAPGIFRSTVISNRKLNPNCFLMRLMLEETKTASLPAASAGQFVMLRLSNSVFPFLPRPFGIMQVHKSKPFGACIYDILYQIAGTGTRFMSTLKPGYVMQAFGPLGNGFTINTGVNTHVIIAGGIGIAGVFMLVRELSKKQDANNTIHLFYGAKTARDAVLLKELKKFKINTLLSTDDGSAGQKGFVTDIYRNFSAKIKGKRTVQVYACGPDVMLNEVMNVAKNYSHLCQISLDRRMACGIGVCRGCVCKTKSPDKSPEFMYSTVCKDGPVFDMNSLTNTKNEV
ncbi:MAG: dihydroorotate dehydrogenase electron transfer subunit [Planctomycetes bacterium]|nr:dihydroorotate dehydrogenase electron transfer subunit [Planctomycetota bacterium]